MNITTWVTISEEPLLEVELSCNMAYDNGDFSYAGTHCTHGVGGVANCGASVQVDGDFEYDKAKFTPKQVTVIDAYLSEHDEDVCDKLKESFWNN